MVIKLMTLVRSSNTPTLKGRFHDGARRALVQLPEKDTKTNKERS